MYDSENSVTTLFIVDGVDTPKIWTGSGTMGTVTTTGTHCPYNHTNTAPITPKYVATAGFYLFYAGEPTEPSAVYISNPYKPQTFNLNSTTDTSIYANPYIPYFIGWNDGISGGDITGIERLGSAMIVYKQSAIYQMAQQGLLGETVWGSQIVSASVGCLSPYSIVSFDTFHVFLGIDGVYVLDQNGTRRISDNVPTFFDGSLNGTSAAILNRTTAQAVRMDTKYLIFFDNGNGTTTPAGLPTTGLWFDFAKLDEDGLPTCGQISGMFPAALVSLRGPSDDGNVAWADATQDRVGKFGLGYSDFGNAISVYLQGRSDFFDDDTGQPQTTISYKKIKTVECLLNLPQTSAGESLTFFCITTADQSASASSVAVPRVLTVPAGASLYGTGLYGVAVYGIGTNPPQFLTSNTFAQESAYGRTLSIAYQESSIYPWSMLGYVVNYTFKEPVAH
jgi:hypothetical protein